MGIDDATDQELLHAFVWGLKDRIRAEVHLRNPRTLDEAARMALDFDELLKPQRKLGWERPHPNTYERGTGNGSGPQPMELGSLRSGKAPRKFDLSKVKCFRCGQFGHMKRDCPLSARKKESLSALQGTTTADEGPSTI